MGAQPNNWTCCILFVVTLFLLLVAIAAIIALAVLLGKSETDVIALSLNLNKTDNAGTSN